MIVAFFHMTGTVPVFHDSLKSFNNVLLVSSPKFFIMSFVTPSGPGAFLHFTCLIASSTSSILIASVIQLSVGGWFFLLIVIRYFPLDSALSSSWLLSFG